MGKENLNKQLFDAVEENDAEKVHSLISQGADFNAKNWETLTPLHRAAVRGSTDTAKVLIDRGANMEAREGHRDFTPLHRAIFNGGSGPNTHYDCLETAKLLIERGSDVNAETKHGQTPLTMAIEWKLPQIVDLLLKKGAKISGYDGYPALHRAVMAGLPTEITRLLKESGTDIDAKDKNGHTPLLVAIRYNNSDAAKLFIEHGANVNTVLENDEGLYREKGQTPLHHAVIENNLEIAKLLLDRNANVNAKDEKDKTPLHYAVVKNNPDIVQMLLDKRAEVDKSDIALAHQNKSTYSRHLQQWQEEDAGDNQESKERRKQNISYNRREATASENIATLLETANRKRAVGDPDTFFRNIVVETSHRPEHANGVIER